MKKNAATFTHSGDAQRLMCVASTVHAKAPRGSAVEGDFSGAHPASTDSTTSLTHASDFPASYLRVSRIANRAEFRPMRLALASRTKIARNPLSITLSRPSKISSRQGQRSRVENRTRETASSTMTTTTTTTYGRDDAH